MEKNNNVTEVRIALAHFPGESEWLCTITSESESGQLSLVDCWEVGPFDTFLDTLIKARQSLCRHQIFV